MRALSRWIPAIIIITDSDICRLVSDKRVSLAYESFATVLLNYKVSMITVNKLFIY